MKRILTFLIAVLFAGTIFGQVTYKQNLIILKTTPTLLLTGTTPTINFNTAFTLTGDAVGLKLSGGLFRVGTDTLSTKSYARSYAGSGASISYPGAGIPLSTGVGWGTSITNNSTNWNTAYTDRLKWDGGATGLTASTGRLSLGGTTVGINLFTLINPSAITYLRLNADNSVSALSLANMQTALGIADINSTLANTEELSVAIPALTGVPLPKLSTTAINAISTPAEGLFLHDLTLHVPKYYNGSAWTQFSTSSATETLTNKTLTSPKINEDVALTATSTYLNRVDATSSIQTQLNTKLAIADSTSTSTAHKFASGYRASLIEADIVALQTNTAPKSYYVSAA